MAKQVDITDVRFPFAGVARLQGYQAQEPFSCPDALNVRPHDSFERRLRGGSRPGLGKAVATDAGLANPVRLLNSVLTGQELPQQSSFEDDFSAALAATWSIWTGLDAGETIALPTIEGGRAILDASAVNDEFVGAIRDTIAYNASASIEIETKLWTSDNMSDLRGTLNTVGQRWTLAMGLDSSADYDGAVVVSLFNSQGGSNLDIAVYNQGTTKFTSNGFSVTGNVVRLVFLAGGTLQIFMGSANNLVATVTGITLTGDQVGFGAWKPTGASRDAGFEYFNFRYTPAASATPIAEPAIVKSVNGSLYYESAGGTITEVTGQNVDLASNRLLSSAERFGKLYIADYEVIAEGTDGVTAGSGTAPTFDSATYRDSGDNDPNWDDDSNVTTAHRIELLSGGSGTYTAGVYVIASVPNNAPLTLTSPTSLTSQSGSSIPFRILRPTKVFDYRLAGAGKLINLARSGNINPPIGCTLAAVWLDRLVLSGDPENPGDIYMSEQGDPTNWTEDGFDTSPVYGEYDTDTRINEPVTALIAFSLDYLVIGGVTTIHVLRGNPVRGGTVDAISRTVGIVDKHAWCITPEGYLVALTGDGLYIIDGMAQSATPLSRDRMPKDFVGFDTENNDIQLAFDVDRNDICIAVTPKTEGTGTFYRFDWQTKSFWPDAFTLDHHPAAMTVYTASGESTPKLVWGCRDGYLREFLDSQQNDDGIAFESYVLIGPIALGGNGYLDGMLRELVCQLAVVGASARLQFQVGDSVESAYRASPRPRLPIIVRPGKGLSQFPRLRGNACFIRLSGEPGNAWAMEQLTMVRERLGKQRLLA